MWVTYVFSMAIARTANVVLCMVRVELVMVTTNDDDDVLLSSISPLSALCPSSCVGSQWRLARRLLVETRTLVQSPDNRKKIFKLVSIIGCNAVMANVKR